MFAAFSSNLKHLALAQDYRLDYWINETGEPSMGDVTGEATYMAFQKVDIATLICLHIIDATKKDWREVLAKDADHLKWAGGLLDRLQNVAIIYVLAGEGPAPWHSEPDSFEAYYGQQAYSAHWWLDINSGAVTVPKTQPSQLFGIRNLIEKARTTAKSEVIAESSGHAPRTTRFVPVTAEPKHRTPVLTILLIAINAVILGLMYWSGFHDDIWVAREFGAMYPPFMFDDGQWYRLFTAMFVHFGPAHLFANVMGLIIFGTRVERYFGRVAFIMVYVISGLLGSLFSLYFNPGHILAAGASGAIYGLIGMIFVYTRITGRAVELMNWYTMFMFIGVGIAMGFMTPGVDNFGHVGGLVGGLAVGAGMVGVLRLRGR